MWEADKNGSLVVELKWVRRTQRGLHPLGNTNFCTLNQDNSCLSLEYFRPSVQTQMVNNRPNVWRCSWGRGRTVVVAKKQDNKLDPGGFTFRDQLSLNFKDLLSLHHGVDSLTTLLPIGTQRTSALNFASLQGWLFSVCGITEWIPVAHSLPTTAWASWIA